MFIFTLFYIIRYSQRGKDECCVRGQWQTLRCQWELPIWMCVCIVVSCLIFYFFVHLLIFHISLLKSSDLSMVNPHISLNLWHPLIHDAILGFSKDFYCEIHGFHWQSSDLAVDLFKSSSGSEEFISFCLSVSEMLRGCLLHNLWLSHFHADSVQFESWTFMNTDLNTDHRSLCLCWVSFL